MSRKLKKNEKVRAKRKAVLSLLSLTHTLQREAQTH